MIEKFEIENFGPHQQVAWENLAGINIVTGENGSGKTALLKMLYAVLCSLWAYRKGSNPYTLKEILSDKLYWTFQVGNLGNLVKNKEHSPLFCRVVLDGKDISFTLNKRAKLEVDRVRTNFAKSWEGSTIFVPPKEIFSLFSVIRKSREQDKLFGFDDTYLDLSRALYIPTRENVDGNDRLVKEKAIYDEKSKLWCFEDKNSSTRFSASIISDGTKKLAAIDRLLDNKYLSQDSIIFIDEPEASLSERATVDFLKFLCGLSKRGMQIFMATHSPLVVKSLHTVAQRDQFSIRSLLFDTNRTPKGVVCDFPFLDILSDSLYNGHTKGAIV